MRTYHFVPYIDYTSEHAVSEISDERNILSSNLSTCSDIENTREGAWGTDVIEAAILLYK